MRRADGGQESPDHSTCLASGEILRPVALPCGCCLRSDSSGVPRAHDFPPLFCTPEPSAPETYHDVPSNTLTCPLTCREGWTAGSSPPVTRRPLRAGRSRVVRRFRPVPFASRRSTFRLLMVAPLRWVVRYHCRAEWEQGVFHMAGHAHRTLRSHFGAIRSRCWPTGCRAPSGGYARVGQTTRSRAPAVPRAEPSERGRSAPGMDEDLVQTARNARSPGRHGTPGIRSAATAWAGASTGGVGDQLILYASLMNTVPGSL